jgi:hypothetical protein
MRSGFGFGPIWHAPIAETPIAQGSAAMLGANWSSELIITIENATVRIFHLLGLGLKALLTTNALTARSEEFDEDEERVSSRRPLIFAAASESAL